MSRTPRVRRRESRRKPHPIDRATHCHRRGQSSSWCFRGQLQLGSPLVGLVASVSIGGLAVALAAQDTLKNLLGSLMIFIDQPYQGRRADRRWELTMGSSRPIGLRSTRIRQLDGHLTAIPNEKMATMEIENVERREHIRRKTKLRIATGTSREKLRAGGGDSSEMR